MRNRVVAAAFLGMVAVLGTASPAVAGTNIGWFSTTDGGTAPWNDRGAKARFEHIGNKFTICDTDADRRSARGFVYSNGGNSHRLLYIAEVGGDGKCWTSNDPKNDGYGPAKQLTEGAKYSFTICVSVPDRQLGAYCSNRDAIA